MTNDMIKQNAGSISSTGSVNRGLEAGVDKSDIEIPRVKLLQALSPEVTDNPEKYRPGMIINSISGETMPGVFIPVLFFKNWVRFNPRGSNDPGYDAAFEPGAVIWRTDDPTDSRVSDEGKFGENGETPLATAFLNFLCYFPGHSTPVVLSFSKTGFKAGKRLLSLCALKQGDIFSRAYKIDKKQVKGDKGTYYQYTVELAGDASAEDYAIAESLWEKYHAKPIKVSEETHVDAE